MLYPALFMNIFQQSRKLTQQHIVTGHFAHRQRGPLGPPASQKKCRLIELKFIPDVCKP